MSTPDNNARGFLAIPPEPRRYENSSNDPDDVAARIATLIKDGDRVLDVGCGTGSVSETILNRVSADLIGIEPDAERAAAARERGLDVYQGFLTEEFLAEHGPFHKILFADVLEHLPAPAEMVLLAKRGLAPSGAIVASVPNVAHWFVRADLVAGRFVYQDCGIMDATHLRWFTRRSIQEFFEHLGFRVTALDYTVNIDLPDYGRRRPWRWFSRPMRKKIVSKLAALRPEVFGCQHIVRAEIKEQATK